MDWIRRSIYHYVTDETDSNQIDLFDQPDEQQRDLIRGFGLLLGRQIWNAIPFPGNDFQTKPMPSPGRRDPCICGSGRQYQHCCRQVASLPQLETRDIWPALLECLSPNQLERAYEQQQVPIEVLTLLAVEHLEQGRARKAIKILEPLFDPKPAGNGEEYDFALNTLCNCYDHQGFHRKKTRLLNMITQQAPRSPLRSGAWQRMAAIRMDEGNPEGAWQAFQTAQRDDPGATSLGLLEIQLLLAQGRAREAQERARIWLRQLRRADVPDDAFSEFFEAVASDPHAAMLDIGLEMGEGAGEQLRELIPGMCRRALPIYFLKCLPEDGDLTACIVQTPTGLEAIEQAWHDVYPVSKPFSIQEADFVQDWPWDEGAEAMWSEWLATHPEAADSLDVLDDLVMALQIHMQSAVPGWDELMLRPLLERACDIVAAALENQQGSLPWTIEENRPALRLLLHRMDLELRAENDEQAQYFARLLLTLNPTDNHVLRIMVMNEMVRAGDLDAAMELARAYPDDFYPDIPFSLALALYARKQSDAADTALIEAMEEFPLVADMLLKKSAKKATLRKGKLIESGAEQAWMYRQEMRDAWQAVPGAMAWLKHMRGRLG